jgi:hypothetical protein
MTIIGFHYKGVPGCYRLEKRKIVGEKILFLGLMELADLAFYYVVELVEFVTD